MDHKQQLSKLDPKLKEVYDRVMGTDVPAPTPHTATTAQTPEQTAPPMQAEPAASENKFVVTSGPVAPSPVSPPVAQQPLRRAAETVQVSYQLHPKKTAKKGTFPMPLIILSVVVFFVIYTFAWMQIFHISIPFLGF